MISEYWPPCDVAGAMLNLTEEILQAMLMRSHCVKQGALMQSEYENPYFFEISSL
jgi:hypothetical protein